MYREYLHTLKVIDEWVLPYLDPTSHTISLIDVDQSENTGLTFSFLIKSFTFIGYCVYENPGFPVVSRKF